MHQIIHHMMLIVVPILPFFGSMPNRQENQGQVCRIINERSLSNAL